MDFFDRPIIDYCRSRCFGFVCIEPFLLSFCRFPWTRDPQIRANAVSIALRVSDPIIRIPLNDNQRWCRAIFSLGLIQVLIRPVLLKAEGMLGQTQANLIRAKQQLDRDTVPYSKKLVDLRDLQDA
jgi:hypothetical protein